MCIKVDKNYNYTDKICYLKKNVMQLIFEKDTSKNKIHSYK